MRPFASRFQSYTKLKMSDKIGPLVTINVLQYADCSYRDAYKVLSDRNVYNTRTSIRYEILKINGRHEKYIFERECK